MQSHFALATSTQWNTHFDRKKVNKAGPSSTKVPNAHFATRYSAHYKSSSVGEKRSARKSLHDADSSDGILSVLKLKHA